MICWNFWNITFDDKSFFDTLVGFVPYWNYKPTNAIETDSPGVYTSVKNLYLRTIDKNQLKCDVIDGSVVNGLRQSIIVSFTLDKPSGFKLFLRT